MHRLKRLQTYKGGTWLSPWLLFSPSLTHIDVASFSSAEYLHFGAFIFFLLSSVLISWPATQSSTVTGLGLLLNSSNLSHLLGLFSFTTSCCSPLLQILQFALLGLGKRQPRSSSDQTSIGPLRALALGSFISFFSWHAPSCILPNALMQQWKSFWKWPRPFSFFVPQLTPTERTRRNCGRGEGGEERVPGQLDTPAHTQCTHWETKPSVLLLLVFRFAQRSLWRGKRLLWLYWSSSSWTPTVISEGTFTDTEPVLSVEQWSHHLLSHCQVSRAGWRQNTLKPEDWCIRPGMTHILPTWTKQQLS